MNVGPRLFLRSLFLVVILQGLFGCAVVSKAPPTAKAARPRNIIIFIGDGMGPQQISLAWLYAKRAPFSTVADRTLNLERLMTAGQIAYLMTPPAYGLVNDSACAASQFASGLDCRPGTLGLDEHLQPTQTIFERARSRGMRTGLVSDTRITHATPAGFVAHAVSRAQESEIAESLLDAHPDLMLSGGLRYFLPQGIDDPRHPLHRELRAAVGDHLDLSSKRSDQRNLLGEAHDEGYSLAFSRQDLATSSTLPLLGLFATSAMPDAIEDRNARTTDPLYPVPSLREMTEHSLRLLQNSPSGFLLMIEAGQIDWAGHSNDAGALLHEMLRLDEALGAVLEWNAARDDTLVILTADHETGGFGFSYSASDIPGYRARFGDAMKFNFGDPAILDELYQQRMSYHDIIDEFESLPPARQTPETLRTLIARNTNISISYGQALEILAREPNRYRLPNHEDLAESLVPKIHDFTAFYPDTKHNRSNLIGRVLAERLGIVWGTGGHTATPVPLVALPPTGVAWPLRGVVTGTELGRVLAVMLTPPNEVSH